MWVLVPIAWPFLVLYLMVRLWRFTLPAVVIGVIWWLSVVNPLAAWIVGGIFAVILIAVLRIREQDGYAREAANQRRAVERDLDRRDRHLDAGRADRARMEMQAEMIAKALVREAGKVRR